MALCVRRCGRCVIIIILLPRVRITLSLSRRRRRQRAEAEEEHYSDVNGWMCIVVQTRRFLLLF